MSVAPCAAGRATADEVDEETSVTRASRRVAHDADDVPPAEPADTSRGAGAAPSPVPAVPPVPAPRSRRATAQAVLLRAAVVLVVGAVAWFVALALAQVALLTGALLVALLLAALLEPAARGLRRLGLPAALAAGVTTVVLIAGLAAVVLLVYSRATAQLSGLGVALTTALDEVRRWLVEGPLALDPTQVQELRDIAAGYVQRATPTPVAGARTALRMLSAAAIVVFAVFFLLKDGHAMWRWVLGWTRARHRERVDAAGTAAWTTLTAYVRGTVVVAAVDAVGIGTALVVLGVPMWFSLTILTFFGAFVPIVGATVAGAAAVLVTLVTEGGRDAVLVLVVVLAVQQLEGNLLQPLIMGRAVRLHPLAILSAVTAGVLLLGVIGALIAVPLTAVAYRVATTLRDSPSAPSPDPDAAR